MSNKKVSKDKIAIIGMSTRFPGADNYNELWKNLEMGKNSIREISRDRWNIEEYYSVDINEINKSVSKWCGMLDNIDLFDAHFFNILPKEADSMDPQQRILLEETWKCIEDSAVSMEELQSGRTGVYAGIFNMDYKQKIVVPDRTVDCYEGINGFENHIANRISYQFNFNGPSIAINTACSSGLVSIIQAMRSLQNEECDYALASGVNLNIDPYKYIAFSKYRMLSPDGQCKTFDKDANGYVPGDGVGVFLLQKLEDAIQDGNHIYGVIAGAAINHTGKGHTLTAPNVKAQMEVIEQAYKEADINLESVNYIEAHGTGTSLGDPIEVEAINNVFSKITNKKNYCAIGSVKTNIGHLEAAAGIASVAKVLLMFKNRKIPPTINLKEINQVINFDDSALKPAWDFTEWKKGIEGEPRRAAVSSFGFGGTNAHILLEEYENSEECLQEEDGFHYVFNLSAKNEESLLNQLEQWKEFVKTDRFKLEELKELCLNLTGGRESFNYRCGQIVHQKKDIIKFLDSSVKIEKKSIRRKINITQNREYKGYTDVKSEYQRFPEVESYIDRIIPARIEELKIGTWDQRQKKAFSLVVNTAALLTLSDYGLQPDYVTGSDDAVLLSMIYAGILSVEEVVDCILNNKNVDACSMRRPVITYYDKSSQKYIYPLKITAEYLKSILEIEISQEFDGYLIKGRDLFQNQFTFKKFVEEWNESSKVIFHQTVEDVLFNVEMKWADQSLYKERLLIAIIMASSLRRLNLKWNLKEQKVIKNEKFYELLDLITDEVLTKQMLVDLLFKKDIDLNKLVDKLEKRQEKLKITEAKYKCLKEFSTSLSEIFSIQEWIANSSNEKVEAIENAGFFNIRFDDMLAVLEEAWLYGIDVKWRKVFARVKYKKLSLPSYCFIQKHFWISSDTEQTSVVKEENKREAQKDPLCTYEWKIDDNYQALKDHLILKQNIIPGAAMFSVVLERLECMTKQRVWQLNSLSLLNAAKEDDYLITIDDDKKKFTITADKKKFLMGSYKPIKKSESREKFKLPINFSEIDTNACYKIFSKRGYDYGDSLQVIKEQYLNGSTIIYKLKERTESKFETLSEYLLDGVFQSILYTFYQSNHEADKLLIPHIISSIGIYQKLQNACYVCLNSEKIKVYGNDIMTDAWVYDENSELVLEIKDILFKTPDPNFLQEDKVKYYETVWHKESIDRVKINEEKRVAIAFLNNDVFSNYFNKELSNSYKKKVIVKKGEGTGKEQSGDFYLKSYSGQSYLQLFESIHKQQQSIVYDIYFLWSIDSSQNSQLNEKLENGVYALYHLFKACFAMNGKANVRIMLIMNDCHVILEQDKGMNYVYGAIDGFSRSLMKEMRSFLIKVIDLDEISMHQKDIIPLLLTEMVVDNQLLIGYRNGLRYVQKLRLKEEKEEKDGLVLEDSKNYIIVGGMGGIGQKVIKQIAKTADPRIIIIGRKKREELADSIFSLSKKNKIVYFSCDVSDYISITECIIEIKKRYGHIHGIIHAGGIIQDQYLVNKQFDSFKKVLSPKIMGGYYLNELTKDEPLDFYIIFSSIVSVIGNAGQVDYAAANSFLDTLIRYRQVNQYHGKSIGVNWTLWTDGGMGRQESIVQKFTKTFGTISDTAAIKGFKTIINQDSGQYIVTDMSDTFSSTICDENLNVIEKEKNQVEETIQSRENKMIHPLDKILISLLAKVIQVSETEIDTQTDIREYGLESIMLSEFSEHISDLLQDSISPTIFYEYSSIKELSEYLKENYNLSTLNLKAEIPNEPSDTCHTVCKIVSEILQVNYDEIDGSTVLREFGLDAVTFTQLAERINEQFETQINEKLFEQYTTSEDIARYLDMNLNSECEKIASNDYESDIAIIGVSGRFPGAANVEEFFENLMNGMDSITEIPKERWDWKEIEGNPLTDKNKTYSKWGGFLENIDKFDAEFFKISPHEAALMDPQQRLLMEVVWHTLEDADYKPSDIKGSDTGVFVGVCNSDYNQMIIEQDVKFDAYTSTGTYFSILPNRVSYLLDIHGPSIAIDTACSSSLVAMHQAVEAIKCGDCSMAFVAGVNVNCTPRNYIAFGNAGMLSKDGRCKTFDDNADGYVRGEGIGVVLLKPLKKAMKDLDNIYGVIKGTAINHGGYANSLTAPNIKSQADVIKEAYKRANVDTSTVSYIEAHGTGTSLGDPIEVEALKKSFENAKSDKKQYCGIGSVKTNIGHLESASGIAGVIKILMMMKYGKMVKSLHFKNRNKYINIEDSPFYFVTDSKDWQHNKDENGVLIPYKAGVSSFGFGGANCHVVLEEYVQNQIKVEPREKDSIVVLSAKNEQTLIEYAKCLKQYLHQDKENEISLSNVSYSLIVGRKPMEFRLAIIATNLQDLIQKLSYFIMDKTASEDIYIGTASSKNKDNAVVIDSKDATYSMLADAWVKGEEVVWDALFYETNPYRISLPVYPFQRKSYWLPKREKTLDKTESGASNYELCYYDGVFVSVQDQNISTQRLDKNTVVFCEEEKEWLAYIEKNDLTDNVMIVKRDYYTEHLGGNLYSVDLQEDDSWVYLKGWFSKLNFVPELVIYCERHNTIAEKSLEEHWKDLFLIFKKFVFAYKDKAIYFTYNYLDSNINEIPYEGSVSGFMKSLRKEEPGLHMKSVRYDQGAYQCETIVQECFKDWYYEVAYENDIRLVRKMKKIQPSILTSNKVVYKENGVYLVTGGFGGVGYQVAKEISTKVNATIILVGRSEMDADKRERCFALSKQESKAIYIQSDITKKDNVERLLKDVKSMYGSITGVIHCAGVIHDQYFYQKDIKDIEKVLAPKIKGTIYLDEVLKAEPLDFFVMFSSLVAEIGNAGQSDYAYANAFMNHFAIYRNELCKKNDRCGHTISIAWPFWLEGGMSLSEQQLQSLTKMTGKELSTDIGLNALENLLQTDIVTCAVTYKENNQDISFNLQQEAEGIFGRVRDSNPRSQDIVEFIENEIKEIFEVILEVPKEEIKLDVSFRDYGVDSIMINHFNEIAEQKFGKLSKTLLYEYSTITELVEYLAKNKRKDLANIYIEKSDRSVEKGASKENQDIAVIGISGQYAMAENIEEYWEILKEGRDCISVVPENRWIIEDYYDKNPDMASKGKMYSKWGGFIKNADKFDSLFFGISPKEAETMDPQERIFLEEVYKALEDAGINYRKLNKYGKDNTGSNVGVFVGATTNTYSLWGTESMENNPGVIPNTFYWSIANRVSYLFDFTGPSLAIDTACSSSLAAIHLAVESLHKNECEIAITGGVNLYSHPIKYIQLSQMKMLSPTGKCHPYGDDADGFVPGEGAGAIVLKRLSAAKRDHDRIYAVIKGSAMNHDGCTSGYTVPNPNAQARVIKTALENANVNSNTISYVEGHGTGTKLGDPIEVTGLTKAFKDSIGVVGVCSLGSSKSNIGHLEAAAGIAGITKVILQMKYKQLVPTLHCEKLNSNIYFEDTPFFVQRKLEDWSQPKIRINGIETTVPRRSVISGFGAGGTNVSIILEEYENGLAQNAEVEKEELLILSAKNETSLRIYAKKLGVYIMEHKEISLKQIAYTLQKGRSIMDEKLAIVVTDRATAARLLMKYSNNEPKEEGIFTSNGFDVEVCNLNKELKQQVVSFLKGNVNDWRGTFVEGESQIVSLPSYPFNRKSYWFNSFSSKKEEASKDTLICAKVDSFEEDTCEELIEYNTSEVKMEIIEDSIALIRMEDRINKNLFTTNMHLGLWDKINKINKRDDIKTVILTGYDNLFCMGGTNEQLTSIAAQKSKCSEMSFVYRGMLECKVPVIAAMQGHALGGGFVLGMFADITVMSKESIYSTNFTRYGFTPGVGSTYIIRERLGSSLANEMMFTAKSFTGEELQQRGASFIFEEQEKVVLQAISIARMLAKKPRETLVALKHELAGRILQVIPDIIKSEVNMHNEVFSKVDVSDLIEHYFYSDETTKEEEKKEELVKKLVLKNPQPEVEEIMRQNKKLQLRTVRKQEEKKKVENKKDIMEIKDMIQNVLSEKLHIPIQDISPIQTFRDLGVDSISAVEIIRDLNKELKLNMDAVCIFDYPNVEMLSKYISEEWEKAESPRIASYNLGDSRRFFSSTKTNIDSMKEEQLKEHQVTQESEIFSGEVDVLSKLFGIIQDSLHIEKEDVSMKKPLKELGLDSINVIEIVNKVNKEFLLNEETIIIYDYPTLEELGTYLKQQIVKKDNRKKNESSMERKNFGASAEAESKWFRSINKEKKQDTEKDNDMELVDILSKFKNNDIDINEVELYLEDLL